jgi:hypothetical protein
MNAINDPHPGFRAIALLTFPIALRITQIEGQEISTRGRRFSLPLPHSRLAKFDEYLTNSHVFNLADLTGFQAENQLESQLLHTPAKPLRTAIGGAK